jgi:hypothetical protein
MTDHLRVGGGAAAFASNAAQAFKAPGSDTAALLGTEASKQAANMQGRADTNSINKSAANEGAKKGDAASNAAHNNGEKMMAQMDKMASEQQKFALHQGLTEMMNKMTEALAKSIKNIGNFEKLVP